MLGGGTLINVGTILGGDGGLPGAGGGPSSAGAGAAAIVGANLTIINSNIIIGGLDGNGLNRAARFAKGVFRSSAAEGTQRNIASTFKYAVAGYFMS